MFKKILNHWPTKFHSMGFTSGRGDKQYFKKIAAEGTKQNKSNFCFRDTEETSLHSGIMDVLWVLWIWARFEKAWYARISQWGNSDEFWSGVLFEESDVLRLIRQRYTRLKMVEKLRGHCNNWGTRWQDLTQNHANGSLKERKIKSSDTRDFPGGPVVETLPFKAEGAGSILG